MQGRGRVCECSYGGLGFDFSNASKEGGCLNHLLPVYDYYGDEFGFVRFGWPKPFSVSTS